MTEVLPAADVTRVHIVRPVIGAIAFGVATVQYFLAQVVAAAAWTDPVYSWNRNYISDLGATLCGPFTLNGSTMDICSPLHGLMNASFIAAGVLTFVGALLLRSVWKRGALSSTGTVLMALAGIGKIIVGLVPENVDITLHTTGALNLVVGCIAILLLSISWLRAHRTAAALGIATAVVGLLGGTLFTMVERAGQSPIPGLGLGALERIAGYPSNLWMLGVGILVIAMAIRENDRAGNSGM